MKALVIEGYKQEPIFMDRPVPTIGDKEILVKIHAASVNPFDLKVMKAELKILLDYQMPLTLGSDFAGTVVEVGKK